MSNRVTPATRRRIVLALLLLAAVAAVGLTAPRSVSAIGLPGYCQYYSDATYTTVVGSRSIGCCGQVTTTGTVTPYVRCQRVYCPAVVCPVLE